MGLNFGGLFGKGDEVKFEKNKTYYLSYGPADWIPQRPDVEDVNYSQSTLTVSAGDLDFFLTLHLPHGAQIVSVLIYGSDTGESWQLHRSFISASSITQMIGAGLFGTRSYVSDETIGLIDNLRCTYNIRAINIPTAFSINGTTVEYTMPVGFADVQKEV